MRAAEAVLISEKPAPFDVAALFDGLAGLASVAIAVSGGSDSMALVRLTHAWAKNVAPRPQLRLVALTVDHGLRPESAAESTQVAAWCAELGIEHQALRWDGPKPTTGLQAKARQARYDVMTAYCADHGIGVLLTGHTLDDQAETFAMRAARTNSVAALAGIWPETRWNSVRILRPLLALRREALRDYLRAMGQGWIDDPSNDDLRFERVRVRVALQGADVEGLAHKADDARELAAETEAAANAWIATHVTQHPESHFTFDKVHLLQEARLVQRAVLAKLVGKAGTGAPLGLRELEHLVGFLGTGGRRTLGGALVAARFRKVIIVREAGRIEPEWQEVGPDGILAWDRRFIVTAPPGSRVGPARLAPAHGRPDGLPFYVHEACPLVKLPRGETILAQNSGRPDVSAQLV